MRVVCVPHISLESGAKWIFLEWALGFIQQVEGVVIVCVCVNVWNRGLIWGFHHLDLNKKAKVVSWGIKGGGTLSGMLVPTAN